MSYDIRLVDENRNTIEFNERHYLKGGTYSLNGTREAHLNVTYNYFQHFRRVIDQEAGIRWLYGKKAANTISRLKEAIGALRNDVSPDYWEPTEGNARAALVNLLKLAEMAPDGVWDGD